MSTPERPLDGDGRVPPATETIHLPEPSLLPAATAAGVTLVGLGLFVTWVLSAFGGAVLLVSLRAWVRRSRRSIARLPQG